MDVPITLEYQGKSYTGHLRSGFGAGGEIYSNWQLMIDNYYNGTLHYSEHAKCWLFYSNSGKFNDLSDYFEAYLVGWFA